MSQTGIQGRTGSYGRRVSLPGVSREVEDILLWRDVRVSGGVFVGITLLYLLLEWSGLSLLTIFSNTLLGVIALAFIWNNVAKFTGKSGVPLPGVVQHGVNDRHLKSLAESLSVGVNKALAFTNRLISGQDVILTVKVAAGLYVFAKVGNYFSSLGLLYTVAVLAFTVPKIYELKKDDIDNAVSTASHQGKAHYKNYVEPYVNKIPRASTSTSSASGTTSTLGGGNQGGSQSMGGNQGYGSNQTTGGNQGLSGNQGPSGNQGLSGNQGGSQQLGGNQGYGGNQSSGGNPGYERTQGYESNQGNPLSGGNQGGSQQFGGGSQNLGGTQGFGGNQPSGNQGYGSNQGYGGNRESDNDSFTDVAREAVAGVNPEGKKLS